MVSQFEEPIAIVGSGCRFPSANSPSALWKLLENPHDVSQEIPGDRFDVTGFFHPDGSHHGTTNVRRSYLLQENLRMFDAAFFNISPNEADSMDPQQRLLLEVVFEALEAGGHPIEGLRGSDTAVYVGTMGVDYNDTLLRDLNNIPVYFATGTNRAIISNRISYFYDWHGPSMTIDTACSSSLIAVHQAVQTLRTGESRVALACGTQVILGPEVFVFESKMKMLSPTGYSRMWDADADGYARGEGVAAIVLKRLKDAIADGDHIECLIRGTGANQDGHSTGLTVPSSEAQAALIRQTYARAGLNPEDPRDRPQFFEAHGTGTKAGDPKEAAAIHRCFGQPSNENESSPLYVGSIKTVIGHTEGAAGLAGLLKGSGIIQKGFIPPNLLFNNLNPAIEPYYERLHVPTRRLPWPSLPQGVPRRVSVNSFGFGGSNAHAILEEYFDSSRGSRMSDRDLDGEPLTPFIPFVFSAGSEASLVSQLQAYSQYLKMETTVNILDLASTLQSRRSQLPVKVAFAALTVSQLISKIDSKLVEIKDNPAKNLGVRSSSRQTAPRILGVFTGQGAQWAEMGAQLIRASPFVREIVQSLNASLQTLPLSDRPQWNLQEEMLAGPDASRISEAELSQPLCTAMQVVLVKLLRAAGIELAAVVGHSSGEISAAYAAGFLSESDAIRIAYYRGFHARLARGSSTGQAGAMLAVGTSWEDAQDLINLRTFRGRVAIAAHNSSASVTLSGDADAIVHAKRVFDEEKKFARLLKVDTAYHSHHMLPCGDPYISSLRTCKIRLIYDRKDTDPPWFSSVNPHNKPMELNEGLEDLYWKDNMTQAVLFADAVKNAVSSHPDLGFVLEIGPHPALKGPATQNISDIRSASIPYSGLLGRGRNDIEAFADALGSIWTHMGPNSVDFKSFAHTTSSQPAGDAPQPKLVVGLPSYPWNHGRIHWHESRRSQKLRSRKQAFHELLGVLSPESTPRDLRWSNVLKISEIPWLNEHQLQGQPVFPAAGYVAMALEASRGLSSGRAVQLFEIHDLYIPKAITFEEDVDSGIETLVTLTAITTQDQQDSNSEAYSAIATADFSCYSCAGTGTDQEMELMASGSVKVVFGAPLVSVLPFVPLDVSSMSTVDTDRFYQSLSNLGYGYNGPFRGMSSLKRRHNQSSVLVSALSGIDADSSTYLVHPTWLDVAFQASMLAYSAPGDERLWSLHVPTSIKSIRVNPEVCASLPASEFLLPVCALLDGAASFSASIEIFSEDGQFGMVQVEDLTIKPFAPATEADDRHLFTSTKWDFASPDGTCIVSDVQPTSDEIELAIACERVSYHFICKWKSEIAADEWTGHQEHFSHLRDYVDHTLSVVAAGKHASVKREWSNDSPEEIEALLSRYSDNVDIKLISAVGTNIPDAVRGQTTILEHMLPNNLLDDFYKEGLGFARYNSFMAAMMKQVVHRYPHAKILEIGAGTGGATKSVLEQVGNTMSSYTYTDVSVGFFEKAAELFRTYSHKMNFKVLDVEKAPSSQGFEAHSYDVVIASNVLHATASLQRTLDNTRQLLKPGGYLILLEITNNGPIRFSNIMGGLPGWWLGVGDGRKFAPTATPGTWHNALRKSGFSGIDAITPDINVLPWPFSIIAAQAVDDRVNFLRRPLSHSASQVSIYLENLVIIGTETLETARIAEGLIESLGRFCGKTTILSGLPTELEAQALDSGSTFVNLVDLDSPIFNGMTAEKMEGLKRIFELAKQILWVTSGAQSKEPYHMASISFGRAMSHETGHICWNYLDVSDLEPNVSNKIAEYLVRQCALDEWESGRDSQRTGKLLWSQEPEAFLDRGKLTIPRLINNTAQNCRLNSGKRSMRKKVQMPGSTVSIVSSPELPPHLIEAVIPARANNKPCTLTVESSSLMTLPINSNVLLFVAVGKDIATGNSNVVLSATNSSKMTPVVGIPFMAADTAVSSGGMLVAIVSQLFATALVESVPSGSTILVHCSSKDRILAAALASTAPTKSISMVFTCDVGSMEDIHDQDKGWIKLRAHTSMHAMRRILSPARPTHFLDLTEQPGTDPSNLSSRIALAMPPGSKRIEASSFYQHEPLLPQQYDTTDLAVKLGDAVSKAKTIASLSGSPQNLHEHIFELDKIHNTPNHQTAISTIHWPSKGEVEVQTRPLDGTQLFSAEKTYLLVGLTGEIGRSLCEWMISNGAGCVCLTSRSPKIGEAWMESMALTGATVKVFAMDVTDMQSVKAVVDNIKKSCPPIAGVANGAMVLHDSLFSSMSLDTMLEVLGPKIDGTNNLDQVFFDDELDFFILFSSSACVIGNSGQTNYAAANGYLNSLARKRRSRGLAASTVDIGRVAGLGYVETAGQAVITQLTRFGLMAISESELHQIFAETILAGYPAVAGENDSLDAVVTTGIRAIRDDEEIQGPWFDNPRFSHCIIETKNVQLDTTEGNKNITLPVAEQLSWTKTTEQALQVLQESFSAKLRSILQIVDQAIDPDVPLLELGVDSLVAVEVRSWFLKELRVDIPVLKVVGGASVAELCQKALEKLPKEFFKEQGDQSPCTLPSARPQQVSKVRPRRQDNDSTSESEQSSTVDSMPSLGLETSGTSSTEPSSRSSSSERLQDDKRLKASPSSSPTAPPANIPKKFVKSAELSFGQSRFWFLRHLLEDKTTSNVAFYYHIAGNLRIGDLERAIRAVAARHEALRTCFVEDSNEADRAYQKVMSTPLITLERKRIQSKDEVAAEYAHLMTHVFDLSSGKAIKLVLLSLSQSSHYLLVSYHHILMDGVSFQVFLSDLEKAYNGQSLGAPPRQYPDFSVAQRQAFDSGKMDDELKFWRRIFPDGEQPPVLPLLPMAQITTRVPMKVFEVHQVDCRVDPRIVAQIKIAAKANRSTQFHFYLAAFKTMLFRLTDASALTIGIADANRNEGDVGGSIGFFLNLLPLRFSRQSEQRFADAIAEARSIAYAALANSRLPFDVLLRELNVDRSSSYSPFFQAFFDYRQGAQEKHAWGNCQFEFQELHPGRTAYDITLDITDNPADALVMLRTQKGLYDLTAAKLLLETYIHFLDVLSSNASLVLNKVPLFSEKQLAQAIDVGRGPRLVSDWPETLPHRIDQVAQQNASKTALIDGVGNTLTYSAMSNRINAISNALQNAKIGPGSRVLVFQQAASDWVCSMLAIMRVGGVYVPLDLRNPMPRLAIVAADCQPSAILADNTTLARTEQLKVPSAIVIDISSVPPKSSARIPNSAQPNSPAAILYTSGSTGTPKGIVVTHSGLRNEIEGYTKRWKLGAERVLQQSSFTFNHSSDQIYTGLVNGGMVYIVHDSVRGDPSEITKIVQEHSVTYTKATPSEYLLWMQYGGENLRQATHWRFAFGGGESMTSPVVQHFSGLNLPQLRLFNSYGPTEISISSTKMEIEYRRKETLYASRIPCGYSLPNYHTYVLDEQLKPLPIGMPGEICIGGAGVSVGYLNNKELTDQKFVTNPFASPDDIANGWTRMYRTGDIGHLQNDGVMVFHNRMAGDNQIKIRGLRIELSDIESNIIAAADGVLREAVVTLRKGDPDFLVAFVVFAAQSDGKGMDSFLENLLRKLPLPQYMIPVIAIPLERLPITNHSKVDRKAIDSMPLPQQVQAAKDNEELSETMLLLRQVWRDVLGNTNLGFEITSSTSFFLVGGNSLLVIRLQSRIREVFNVVVRLVDLLSANTLGEMGRKIEETTAIDLIDWDKETATPSIPSFLENVNSAQASQGSKKTVLVTGSTSYLAKYILPQLDANPDIATIHCVAVRDKPSEGDRKMFRSPKVIIHRGNLSVPLLGLSADEFRSLSSQVDEILHLGAVRSFWDNYHALRPTNVRATKELVKLAAPRRIPIHYISTSAVLARIGGTLNAESAAGNIPPRDGTNGYVASRWASERILENSTAVLGIPTFIYRFLPSMAQSGPEQTFDEWVRFIDVSRVIPDMTNWEGRIDMIPAKVAANWLCESVLAAKHVGEESGSSNAKTKFLHCEAPIAINVAELRAHTEQHRGDKGLTQMPVLKWIGLIKTLGFEYFLTSQEVTVESSVAGERGAKFESRR
ncbi:putative hybrid NRPS/PKS enzyme [Nemania sp. FL0916]|nr:putative hybrid NRPS/PKS enzyme [Nemania sp. FL0916]